MFDQNKWIELNWMEMTRMSVINKRPDFRLFKTKYQSNIK